MPPDDARLIERLLADPRLRRRFEIDPVAVAREQGFHELADELARSDPRDGRRLGSRESRSSAAGVLMASLFEGLGFLHDADVAGASADHAHLASPELPVADVPAAAPEAHLPSSEAISFRAVTPAQADASSAAGLAARVQASLSPNPDDWDGNLDDEDAGADEVDGSNEDEPDEGGGEDDDSGSDSGDDSGDGSGEDEPDENESDDGDDSGDDEDQGDSSDDGQDAIGEGSRGEDANDDASDGDSSDGDSSDGDSSDGDSSDGDSSDGDSSDGDSSDGDSSDGDSSDGDSSSGSSDSDDSSDSSDGAAVDAPDDYPGDDAPPTDVAAWMGKQAEARGLPPELPVMAALVESGLKNLDHGDADSVGLFQMRLSVWNQGDYAGYPRDPGLQLKWFLDHAESVKEQRLAQGVPVDDPKQYGDWVADVERPAEQYRGRYQLRLDEARGLLEQDHDSGTGSGDSDSSDGDDGGVTAALDGSEAGGASPAALAALADAKKELGIPYRWGGSSPETGFDCSGLVQWAYAQVGITLPRVTYDQVEVGQAVDRSHLLPGDVIYFRDSTGDVHHCGISLGGDEFIHAPHAGDVVKISSLKEPYYAREFFVARRMASETDGASAVSAASAAGTAPAVEHARHALGRDADEANRPGTRIFKALVRQERGKGRPAD